MTATVLVALCCLCLVPSLLSSLLRLLSAGHAQPLLSSAHSGRSHEGGGSSPLPSAMEFSALFPSPSYPLEVPFPGYDPGYDVVVEEEEEAYQRLLRARPCDVTDLACSIGGLPLSPFTLSTLHTTSSPAGSATLSSPPHRLAYLLLCNSAFVDLAMNLLCSADAVAIPRHHWLIVAADQRTFRFFTVRGFNTVLLHTPLLSSLSPSSHQPAEAEGEVDGGRGGGAVDDSSVGPPSDASDSVDGAGAGGAGGGAAAPGDEGELEGSWATSTHVNINREKIPLLHRLLELGVDVLLFDADMVILHPIDRLFPPVASSSSPATLAVAAADVSIMFDYPYGVIADLYSPDMLKCINSRSLALHAPCSYLWELNGGFFLLRSSPLTRRLVRDMWDWLQQRPTENDQDALRVVLRERFFKRQMRFIQSSGTSWPPLSTSGSSPTPHSSVPSPAVDGRVSVRYLPSLLAPNGGLFFLEGSAQYAEEAARMGVMEPDVVHLNWIIGYGRKVRIAQAHGLWFIAGEQGQGRCSTLHSLTRRRGGGEEEEDAGQSQSSSDRCIGHRNTSYPRLSPSTLSAAATASLASTLTSAIERWPSLSSASSMPLFPHSPSAPLILLFSSPKPLSSFLSLPSHRAADPDGLGERVGGDEMSPAQRAALLLDNQRQVEAQLIVLRSWFGLSDAALHLCQVMLFSQDPHHRLLADALSFDLLTSFQSDAWGAPKLHSLFRSAEYVAARREIPLLLYANGDIALGLDALETAVALSSYQFPELLAVGSRRDLNTQTLQDVHPAVREDMHQLTRLIQAYTAVEVGEEVASAVSAAPVNVSRAVTDSLFVGLRSKARASSSVEALDYFLFSRGLWDWQAVPRFLLGRVGFDNWLLHWANSRKSCVVVDVSDTLSAVHMSHDLHHSSAAQPNGMTNLRLAGQPSRRGVGSLAHVAFRSARLDDGSIRVVRQRPESGHLRSLYDSAEDAAVWHRSRPTVAVVTVDLAFLSVFQNWLLAWRKARGSASASGLLVLSTHPTCTQLARSQALPVFELAQGDKAVAALNDEATAYLQVINLRAKAILFLLEFGYDVLNCHVDTIWLDDPFHIVHTQHTTPSARGEQQQHQRERSDAQSAGAGGGSGPTSSTPTVDGGWSGDELDLVAFSYEPTPFQCWARPANVSAGGLFLRHTPEALRVWRRVSAEYAALVSRATMPQQVNLMNLYEDWYIAFELSENEQLQWGLVCTDEQRHLRRGRSFTEYRQGALVDAAEVQLRMRTAGMWLLGPEVRDAFFRSSLAPQTPPLRRLADFSPLPSLATLPPLSPSELELVRSVATPSGPSISVLGLHSDTADSGAVQSWLRRAQAIGVQHVLLLPDHAELLHTASLQGIAGSFPALLPSSTLPSALSFSSPSSAASPASPATPPPPFTLRVLQLLQAGVTVLLVNPDSVWFEEPLQVLEASRRLQLEEATAEMYEGQQPQLSEGGPASSTPCDLHAHVQRNQSIDVEGRVVALSPTNASMTLIQMAHVCYHQHIERMQRASPAVTGVEGAGDASTTFPSSPRSMSLPLSCLVDGGAQLQLAGVLSVCGLDVDDFPSAHRLFESGDALDSGVWPVVSPSRFVHPRSGRVKEFVQGWEQWAAKTDIGAPNLQRQQRRNEEAQRNLPQSPASAYPADHSVCPPSSFDASLRPHFTLHIKVLSYTRQASLRRLLQSLLRADYGTDRVHLEISVDALHVQPTAATHSTNSTSTSPSSGRVSDSDVLGHWAVVNESSTFVWPFGSKRWFVHDSHQGLVGQWMSAWMPRDTDDTTFMLVLEDDMEVSPVFYSFIKQCICRYYFDPRHFDPHLYGVSLQDQTHILGRNRHTQQRVARHQRALHRRQQQRQREAEQQTAEEEAAAAANRSSAAPTAISARASTPLSASTAELSAVLNMSGQLSGSLLYRYQLVGTWGLLLFPQHWRAFLLWYKEKTSGSGGTLVGDAASASASTSFTPCVPFLDSSVWWARRPQAVWSAWLIRFTFERGWYCLYANMEEMERRSSSSEVTGSEGKGHGEGDGGVGVRDGGDGDLAALAINHREVGENYRSSQGPDHLRLFQRLPPPPAWPRLRTTPTFDFFFNPVHVTGTALAQRPLLLNNRHWKQACRPSPYTHTTTTITTTTTTAPASPPHHTPAAPPSSSQEG